MTVTETFITTNSDAATRITVAFQAGDWIATCGCAALHSVTLSREDSIAAAYLHQKLFHEHEAVLYQIS